MPFFVTVLGGRDLDRKLKRLPPLEASELKKQIAAIAIEIVSDIKDNMRKPARGRLTRRRGRPDHRASAPGDYPAVDEANLISNITFEIEAGGFGAVVGTNVLYGVDLEFGTTKFKARPWLQPSFRSVVRKMRLPVVKALAAAVRKAKRL